MKTIIVILNDRVHTLILYLNSNLFLNFLKLEKVKFQTCSQFIIYHDKTNIEDETIKTQLICHCLD